MKIENLRIAIYIPELTRATGGAEIYGLLMAESLEVNNEVSIIAFKPKKNDFNLENIFLKYGVQKFHTIFVDYFNLKHTIGTQVRHKMNKVLGNYDLFINCSHGRLKGLKNVFSVHLIHFPSKRYAGFLSGFKNKQYIDSYQGFICNSEYTRKYLKEYWNVDGVVVYPPIAMEPLKAETLVKKEKLILAVDRLVSDKKILEMISAFKELNKNYPNDFRFVIIGNKDNKELEYYQKIVEASKGGRIEIYHDLKKSELVEWYKKAAIFWHAKGYGEELDPEMAEHFGMTTAEAMANGCVPVVINKAGQKEIVDHGKDGYRWDTLNELVEYTRILMSDNAKLNQFQLSSIDSSKKFLLDQFSNNLNIALESLMSGKR